ncbi:CbtA family protein [Flexivirga sp. ID2601S]|uniref:CbtA family protein n=1 Tax=Flexivirga aerilata TaxID=1656889 RepID=A0A849AM93_9MICO|nr:CbtA family protein [Flexivirga aerilata]NNG40428.1 CbtA family protein [Flexivirga aerilata]
MEIRVIGRGALAGLVAGILGFVFMRIFAEPLIDQAVSYESSRDEMIAALRRAAGLSVETEGHEMFSRTTQETFGAATGVVGISVAMGVLVAVGFLVLHGKVHVRPRTLAWQIAGFGFLGIFLLPFVKYPASPPAVGHEFTIRTRGVLYLSLVLVSLVLLGLAVFAAYKLTPRLGALRAVLLAGLCFLALFGVALALFPSVGDLPANVAVAHDLGFARAATETPQPITNTFDKTVTVDGFSYAPGQIVFPGFDPDVLWKFRWYSLIEQVIVWSGIAFVFGGLMDRLLLRRVGADAAGAVATERISA